MNGIRRASVIKLRLFQLMVSSLCFFFFFLRWCILKLCSLWFWWDICVSRHCVQGRLHNFVLCEIGWTKNMGRRYSRSPSPRGYSRRSYRSPSPRGRYRSRERDLPTSLLVRNLRHDCRPEDLRIRFGEFGPVKDIYLPRDYYTGEPRGFGFVQFVDPDDAAEAKYQMDGQVLLGRELTVVYAEENRKNPSEMRARERSSRRRSSTRYSRSPRYGRSYSPSPRYRQSYSRSPTPDYYSPSTRGRGRRNYSRSISPGNRRYGERSNSRSPYGSRSRSWSVQKRLVILLFAR